MLYILSNIMSYSGGISLNYKASNIEDVILNKDNIDSDKDVFAASYSLKQMQEIKTELTATINALQTQVETYEARMALLEEKINYLTTIP